MLRRIALVAIASALFAPGSARAAAISIDFDFTGSSITYQGLTVPPNGSITSGSARLSVQGSGIVTPLSGPLNVQSFTLGATFDTTVTATLTAMLTGTLNATQIGTWNGSLTGMLTGGTLSPPLFLNLGVFVGCAGFLCGNIGDFPISSAGNTSITDTVTLMVADLSVSGSAMLSATLTVTLNGATAVFNLVGSEISRTFLPEPSGLLQLGAGGLGLALLALRRRRS